MSRIVDWIYLTLFAIALVAVWPFIKPRKEDDDELR